MPKSLVREALGSPRIWSALTVLLEVSRAASYWFRPPVPGGTIENLIPYHYWTLTLLVSSVLILTGSAFCKLARLALLGHMLGVFCYLTFGTSTLLGAVFLGLGWASMGALYVVAVVHFGLCISVGDRLALRRREASYER
jgi:hypothetical protein